MSGPAYPASPVFVGALMDALGLSAHGSMTELATLTGIDRQTVYRWHRGQTEVRPSHVQQIAVRLGRPIVIVYNGGEE